MRAYQALVAAAMRMEERSDLMQALEWLERLAPPHIVAPLAFPGTPFGLPVPNNDLDSVAHYWAKGEEPPKPHRPVDLKTIKQVGGQWMPEPGPIHYVWRMDGAGDESDAVAASRLGCIARSVVALGWGIDLAVGDAGLVSETYVNSLPGKRWVPGQATAGTELRIPLPGTMSDLVERHTQFLERLGPDGDAYSPPAPLSIFGTTRYRLDGDPLVRPCAAFSLLTLDGSRLRPFSTVRQGLTVAGMLRHATRLAAESSQWATETVNALVLGHVGRSVGYDEPAGARRFAYLPLPSLEYRGKAGSRVVGDIRRALVTSFAEGMDDEINWARRMLSGQDLIDEATTQPVAFVSALPATDRSVSTYTEPSSSWATVTPVVLPGFDDPSHYRRRLVKGVGADEQRRLLGKLSDRIDGLLRKAIVQAGFPRILADHAELDWGKGGFWPGTDLADRYGVPDHLKGFPRYHVRVVWRDESGGPISVPGPICLGGGRFYGLGLFAAE
jgi:CRISPR-associated protein Csb2